MTAGATRRILLNVLDRVLRLIFWPGDAARHPWPDGKSFAFSIVDDTDQATLENIKPMYEWLTQAGMRTTKTVWSLASEDSSMVENSGHSLADSAYRDYMQLLQSRGFEIASHGARGGSSKRAQTLAGLDEFKSVFGDYPRIYVNHASNRENLYWGAKKLSSPLLRSIYSRIFGGGRFEGEVPDSEYFWGDVAAENIQYVVDFSFYEIDLTHIDPSMPFHDPRKPLVKAWFHTADGGTTKSFVNLLADETLDRLEKRGGACIVYTHFGKDFCESGAVVEPVRRRLEKLAARNGWFVPASELLDELARRNGGVRPLKVRQSLYLQCRWILEKLIFGAS